MHLHYLDADGIVISINTKDIIKDLKSLEELIDFSNLNGNHELIINKNEKGIGKFKLETPKIIWKDELEVKCMRLNAEMIVKIK